MEGKAIEKPLPLIEAVRPTTVIEPTRLSRELGADITIVSETFQHTGSFKFRAAYNLAREAPNKHFIAASSGNFGQALAYACSLLGKTCTIVMPANSARVKIDAVKSYGGEVDLIDTKQISREQRVKDRGYENPEAYLTDAYDDPLIIEGNASLATEILAIRKEFDYVIAPIGGGGLSSGIISGLRKAGNELRVVGAEPLFANDAAKSLRQGKIVRNETEPQTIADGARTISLGEHNWAILKDGLDSIVEVSEANIRDALRYLFRLANLKVEPTGALALGAILQQPKKFIGKAVCCVVSGGNVDADLYRSLL